MKIKGAALNPMGYPHYTDHLAAVAVAMDIPLIFTDTEHYEQSLRLYPKLNVQLHDWHEFTPSYIAEHYGIIFVSEMWNKEHIQAKFPGPPDNPLRVVHCPHGFSDKGFWFQQCPDQDITLVYGQNMLDLIAARRPETPFSRYVLAGNLRHTYYKEHRAHFDKLVATDVFSRFARQQPTILYAPTWRDTEASTSFFGAAEILLSQLPDDYNLLVKLHPNLEHDHEHMVRVYEIISKYENKPNVVMLSEYPLIYPLLSACDCYIGDRSAVGYDFLAFNRPMFFLNESGRHEKHHREFLYRCGVVMEPVDYPHIYSILEKSLPIDQERFGKVRQDAYDYTFAKERSFDTIRADIVRVCGVRSQKSEDRRQKSE